MLDYETIERLTREAAPRDHKMLRSYVARAPDAHYVRNVMIPSLRIRHPRIFDPGGTVPPRHDFKLGETREVKTGFIKRVVSDRGFGFIRCQQRDWFFHASGVLGDFDRLAEGQQVEFDEVEGPKGPHAENVRPVSD